MQIPFNQPNVVGSEIALIKEAIERGHLSGNGEFTRRAEEWLENELGVSRALLTHSCTGALEMAALIAGLAPGDEVIMPSFTFPSTANAFVLRGAVPVFVDIRPDTLNLDERLIEAAITARTRAIAPVHYAGVPCELDAIGRVADRHGLMVIEDSAQALGSNYRGRAVGAERDIGALSFHETKNIIAGEGGALLLRGDQWTEQAEIIQEKGTNRRQFFRGQTDKYTWVDVGSSFVMSDLSAAFLCAQLEHAHRITEQRRTIWRAYHDAFEDLEVRGAVRRPIVPAEVDHNAHLYYLLLPDGERRDRFIDALAADGIMAVFHYVPLHSSPAGRRFGRSVGELPVTDATSARLVRLPLWPGMGQMGEVDRVISAVRSAVS